MARKLVVSAPGGQGHEFPLMSPVTTIGRGRGCDLVLDYGFVSPLPPRGEATGFRTMPAGCPVRCDSALWQVWIGDRRLEARLSLQEFELLSLLASRYGSVCTREELGAAGLGRENFAL